jgi:MYXO-CTERM domain-containing protein
VCDKGACVTACRCRACPTGQVCATGGALDGQCVDSGCDKMTCTAGTVCSKGACVDACTNAACPGGVECKNGMCDPAPQVTPTGQGGTMGSGSGGFGGFILTGQGGTIGSGGVAGGARAGSSGATGGVSGASGGAFPQRGPVNGCACEVGGARGMGLAFVLLAAAVVARRRRR